MDARARGHITAALIVAAVVPATKSYGFQPSSGVKVVAGASDAPTPGSRNSVHGQGLAGKVVTIDPGHDGGNAAHPDVINHQVDVGNGQTKECDTVGTQT